METEEDAGLKGGKQQGKTQTSSQGTSGTREAAPRAMEPRTQSWRTGFSPQPPRPLSALGRGANERLGRAPEAGARGGAAGGLLAPTAAVLTVLLAIVQARTCPCHKGAGRSQHSFPPPEGGWGERKGGRWGRGEGTLSGGVSASLVTHTHTMAFLQRCPVPLLSKSPRRLAGHVRLPERKRERIDRIDQELYLILAVAPVWPFQP